MQVAAPHSAARPDTLCAEVCMKSCFVRPVVRRAASPRRSSPLAAIMLFAAGTAGHAQLVTPKTVPIHQDEQFAIFPSVRAGMGGASIALDDSLADPFENPARATRVKRGTGTVFSLPFSHALSTGHGGGSTLPLGGEGRVGPWAGAVLIALQHLNEEPTSAVVGSGSQSGSNQYASFALARQLSSSISLGVSAYVADLGVMDGADLLYSGSDRMVQSGSARDFRAGLAKEWGDRHLDLLLNTTRSDLEQDVHYTIYNWSVYPATTTERSDQNADRTLSWGGSARYVQPFGDDGWRVGVLATASRLWHPEIPNYPLQAIPRDPGSTNAFNLGLGLARTVDASSFALDLVEEPMYSRTWGTAARDTAIAGGGTLHAGERTVDNRFTFSNFHLRAGFGYDFMMGQDSVSMWGIQYGIGAYSIRYRLRQANHVQGTEQVRDEGWVEWTPTLGLSLRTHAWTLRYNFRYTCGPADCVDFMSGDKVNVTAPASGAIIAAPSATSSVNGGTTHVHQLMMTVPIR
jgi:hypothetical protein